jgi:hypothetical protein
MPIHDLAVAARQNRNFEAELADRGAHAIHGDVVLAGIAGVQNKAANVPDLDFERRSSGHAPSLPASNLSRQQTDEINH